MARRARGFDLLAGFEQGMSLAGSVMKTNEDKALKDELAQVAMQTPDGGVDDGGQARTMAQAGILERFGRLDDAARLRTQAQQSQLATLQIADTKARGQRAATEFTWQTEDRARMAKDRATEDEYKAGRKAVFETTSFAQKEGSFAKQMADYQKAKSDYDSAVERGDTTATPPQEPIRPQTTIGETLRDHATILAHDIKYGKASNEDVLKYQQLRKNVEDEGYTRVLKMAQAGAPLTAVVSEFNKGGKQQIDPNMIATDKTVTRENGVKSRIITFKDPSIPPIDTYADLSAVGQGDKLFDEALKLRSAANQDAQVAISRGHLGVAQADAGRRAAEFKAGAPVREAQGAEAALRVQLAKTDDPKEQAKLTEKIQALRSGARGGGGGANADPAMVKNATAMVASGMAPDMATALELLVAKPDQMHKSFIESNLKNMDKPEDAVKKADQVMKSMGYQRNGSRWSKAGGDAGGGTSFASEAEAEAAAKAGKIKKGDKITIGGQSGTWQ